MTLNSYNYVKQFIRFTVYKYKIKCGFDNEIMSEGNRIQKLKYNLILQNYFVICLLTSKIICD